MNRLHRLGAAGLLVLAGACTDRAGPYPTDVPDGLRVPEAAPAFQASSAAHGRQERLARRLALALNDPVVRLELLTALRVSPDPEGKAHFQWLAGDNGGTLRSALARASADPDELARDLTEASQLEVYLPVPAHRSAWQGGPELLVATAITDGDVPVAFDLRGRRILLDRDGPPTTPVLALVPAERRFTGAYPSTGLECNPTAEECGGGGAGATSPPPIGLFMTYASFTSTFESWLKGNPEFETHVLGQNSGTEMKSYQCTGEHAGGPYVYDQNGKTWSGSVVLFSQAQLDAYRVQHPGQALRILVLEDDDGACVIKAKQDRLNNLFKVVDQTYYGWTGGRDSATTVSKIYKKAKALQAILNAIASVINTNDEIVGTAVEDVVAGQTWPGANWIVKGENKVTNGGIRLEMR